MTDAHGVTSRILHSARKLDADGEVDTFWLRTEGGRIVATGHGDGWRAHASESEVVDARGRWLTPGFIDLHGHGAGGHSYDAGLDALLAALETHREHGTTRSVISLVANPVDDLCTSLACVADLMDSDPLVLGTHLEGPFLSPGRRGAHNPDFLIDPDPALVQDFLRAAHGTLRQVTIAPELPNALEVIEILVEAQVIAAVGHTQADADLTRRAFDCGARLLTHVFNAMPGIHHREPGPIVAALQDERVVLELILDGQHVHPDVARIAFDEAPHRIALITDAMAAAGSADGEYRLGSLDVVVKDGLAMLADGSTIAGSTLTQDHALAVAVKDSHIAPSAAVEALTLTPARVLGREHELGLLKPGFAADAVLLDSAWTVHAVWGAGRTLFERETP